jgi:hypothetical protein
MQQHQANVRLKLKSHDRLRYGDPIPMTDVSDIFIVPMVSLNPFVGPQTVE